MTSEGPLPPPRPSALCPPRNLTEVVWPTHHPDTLQTVVPLGFFLAPYWLLIGFFLASCWLLVGSLSAAPELIIDSLLAPDWLLLTPY